MEFHVTVTATMDVTGNAPDNFVLVSLFVSCKHTPSSVTYPSHCSTHTHNTGMQHLSAHDTNDA